MNIKTFFDKNNTIQYNDLTNTGLNPITELYYGGEVSDTKYSRFLFYFDETRIKNLYNDGTFPDLSKIKHTLYLTNTSTFDTDLLNTETPYGKDRATSFDLILFKINQEWDEGVGYDYLTASYDNDISNTVSLESSNWVQAKNNTSWENGNGVYSGSPSGITISTIHFDKGNENIKLDITDTVNDFLSGGSVNYGLGLAYSRVFEETPTDDYQYVGFFTRHTNTFFEPYIETTYNDTISDDRGDFYLDKNNKLYLYVNIGGEPSNLDELPVVTIKDNEDNIILVNSATTHVTKGVYSVDATIPSSGYSEDYIFTDTWSNIKVNGISRPEVELEFLTKNPECYFNIGTNENDKDYVFSINGIKSGEKIIKGDIRKVNILAKIPYTVNQKENIDNIQYRLYIKEGKGEYTVIEYSDVHKTFNGNYFLLDTDSLLPQTYYIDIKLIKNNEIKTNKGVISFDIVNEVNFN